MDLPAGLHVQDADLLVVQPAEKIRADLGENTVLSTFFAWIWIKYIDITGIWKNFRIRGFFYG